MASASSGHETKMAQTSRYISYDGRYYDCLLCNKSFGSDTALETHCRMTSRHSWCDRCKRIFPSKTSKADHLRYSTSHNICLKCHILPDFQSYADLRKHQESTHNMCVACGEFFENENNLRMHRRSHDPKTRECCGCYRKFASFSAMLIHLESGSCDSGIHVDDLDQFAFDCYQRKKYSTDLEDEYPYFCPGCQAEFTTLSGLFQHAETVPHCEKYTAVPECLAKLERFIEKSV